MFERFTDRARRVIVLAQETARLHRHSYIGTEHLLAGLVVEGDGVAGQVLAASGVKADAVSALIEEIIGPGAATSAGHIPFSPRCKKVIELSLRESLQLGHNYISTEHVLLGLIRDPACVGAQILTKLDVELDVVRGRVIETLTGYKRSDPTSTPDPRVELRRLTSHIRAILGELEALEL